MHLQHVDWKTPKIWFCTWRNTEIDWIWGIGLMKKQSKSMKTAGKVNVHGTLETKLELAGQPWPRQSSPAKANKPRKKREHRALTDKATVSHYSPKYAVHLNAIRCETRKHVHILVFSSLNQRAQRTKLCKNTVKLYILLIFESFLLKGYCLEENWKC